MLTGASWVVIGAVSTALIFDEKAAIIGILVGVQLFLAQLARASCASLSWKPRKCASCASARVVPKKQQSDGKYFSFPKRILFQCIWQLLMILCAAGEKKLSSSLTVDIFTIGICSFSSRIPNFSHILEGFSGVFGVRELCRIL